jgi:GcrA cell cycle regulator
VSARHPTSPWTLEVVEQLRAMVAAGKLSCSEMAAEIGIERNAVIGKIYRMGLSGPRTGRPKPKRKPKPKPVPKRPFVVPPPEPAPEPHPEPEAPSATAVTIVGLTEDTCRWPLWNHDGSGERLYCGARAIGRYCAYHTHIAHRGYPEPRPC